MKVQDDARLHPASVQAIARGELKPVRRGRGPDQRPRQSVTSTRLHELVRAHLAGVDPARVQILSESDVVIWNGPRGSYQRGPYR